MLSELHKLSKLIWQKRKMWLQIMKIFFFLQWRCFQQNREKCNQS